MHKVLELIVEKLGARILILWPRLLSITHGCLLKLNLQIWKIFGGSGGKKSSCIAGDLSSIPRLWRSPKEGNSYPFQYSCLENSIHRGAWQATVYGFAKSWTWLSDFHFFLSSPFSLEPKYQGWTRGTWDLSVSSPWLREK